MAASEEVASNEANNQRKYRSPNRVLARSFRLARDKWKQKYMNTRAECDAAKQQSRVAESLAQERLLELEQLRVRELEVKKTLLTNAS